MHETGKALIFFGAVLIIIGAVLVALNKIGFTGKLPGDIYIKRESYTLYFPIVTCIIISVILSLIFYFIRK